MNRCQSLPFLNHAGGIRRGIEATTSVNRKDFGLRWEFPADTLSPTLSLLKRARESKRPIHQNAAPRRFRTPSRLAQLQATIRP